MHRILIALLCATLAFPIYAQTDDQPSGTISVEDSASNDAAMAVRIRHILSELHDYDDVTVTVSSGIATLRGTTLDTASITRLNELVGRVEGIVAIENEVVESTDVVERLAPALERFKDRMAQVIAYLPLLLVAVLAFAIITFVGYLIARMKQPWNRLAPNSFIADIYRQVLRLAFVIGGVVIALDIVGATALLSTILGAAGIIGLAIGFAVRDTVENFIASVMLSIRQPFRPNDTIEIDGDVGKVIRLTSRATILLSFDGNHIRIPNSTVFKSRIINYTRNNERRFVVDLGVGYSTDLTAARQLAQDTLDGLPFILSEPEASVWIEELGDSAVKLRAAGWIDQHETSYALAKGEAMRILLTTFENAGIEMPEPTYRLITDLPLPGAKAPAKPAPKPEPEEISIEVVDTSSEESLERIIAEERKTLGDDDLLNRKAPEE